MRQLWYAPSVITGRDWPAVMLDERGNVGVFGGPSASGRDGWRVELLRAMETES